MEKNQDKGRKFDNGKLRWHLLPISIIQEVIQVLMHGEKKYSAFNWKYVEDGRLRYYDATLRHITKWGQGNSFDSESKLSHLAHAICNLIFLRYLELEGVFAEDSPIDKEDSKEIGPENNACE